MKSTTFNQVLVKVFKLIATGNILKNSSFADAARIDSL